jgi:hypothetical protein
MPSQAPEAYSMTNRKTDCKRRSGRKLSYVFRHYRKSLNKMAAMGIFNIRARRIGPRDFG